MTPFRKKISNMRAAAISATGIAVLATVGLTTSTATAGIVPDLFMSVEVSDGISTLFDSGDFNLDDQGAPAGPFFSYSPGAAPELVPGSPLFTIGNSITTQPDVQQGGLPTLLNPNINVTNNSNQTLEFVIRLWMPINSGLPVDWSSDSNWTLGGPNDPTVFTIGQPLWSVFLDDVFVGSQFDSPSGFGGPGGDLSLGTDPISGSAPPPINSMGVEIAFSITAGANVGINASYNLIAVPAPGALALLGLAGCVGTRRRRR